MLSFLKRFIDDRTEKKETARQTKKNADGRTTFRLKSQNCPTSEVVYMRAYDFLDYELLLSEMQVWIYDTNYVCLQGVTDDQLNHKPLGEMLGHKAELGVLNEDMEMWHNIICKTPVIVETKRSVFYNDRLVYVESRPLYISSSLDSLFAIMYIIIPYKQSEDRPARSVKTYTQLMPDGPGEPYVPGISVIQPDAHKAESSKRSVTQLHMANNKFQLNLHRIHVWVYDLNRKCLHAPQDQIHLGHNMEHYIGKTIEQIVAEDEHSCLVVSRFNEIIDAAYNGEETRTHINDKNGMRYLKVRPLFVNNDRTQRYGIVVVIIPYK
jgi:hypothetical protein